MRIFHQSIKWLEDVKWSNNNLQIECEDAESNEKIIYHLKIVSFLCGIRSNECPSATPSDRLNSNAELNPTCSAECSSSICSDQITPTRASCDSLNDANFFNLIDHENSQIKSLVYNLADKYGLKQTQNVRNEKVMLLKEMSTK